MKLSAKIHCKDLTHKTAILGISLNGNGAYTPEQVDALITQASKFKSYDIVLHGNDEQCEKWEKDNFESLKKIKKDTKIIRWSALQNDEECKEIYKKFISFYANQNNNDFKKDIDETANSYIERHPTEKKENAVKVILEEMAFLTHFALVNKTDCFVYKGKVLPALFATRKYFFIGENQNLLQGVELSFHSKKKKNKKQSILENIGSPDNLLMLKDSSVTSAILKLQRIYQRLNSLYFGVTIAMVENDNKKLLGLTTEIKELSGALFNLLEQLNRYRIKMPIANGINDHQLLPTQNGGGMSNFYGEQNNLFFTEKSQVKTLGQVVDDKQPSIQVKN